MRLGSTLTAYPGRLKPLLSPSKSFAGTPSSLIAKLRARPRILGAGYTTPARARYWSAIDMIDSEARLRPVRTPFVSCGLNRYTPEVNSVAFRTTLNACISKVNPQPPSPGWMDWSTTGVTLPFDVRFVFLTRRPP